MTPKPLISVIVPTFNRPELLKRALDSIDKQMYAYHEAIVVNDGGEDVGRIVAKFKKARYISLSQNQGLPAARNAGLRVAQGEWIAYLDDDDWFYPNHLRILAAHRHKGRFLYSNADYLDRHGNTRLYMDVDPDVGITRRNITPVCCVLHDRKLIEQSGGFDETLPNHEDWDLWIRMSQIAEPYHIRQITCCVDRSHPTMNSDTETMRKGYLEVKCRYLCPESRSLA